VTQYQLQIHTTAKRELTALESAERERLTDEIADVATHRKPTNHPSVRLLEGQDGLYRVRVGDLRAVLFLNKPELIVAKVGKRKDIYENIKQINNKRLSTIRS
jgi:mRNA-degrading endonuclease RelE of RelBE toxin-antitoxin system